MFDETQKLNAKPHKIPQTEIQSGPIQIVHITQGHIKLF